jgi:hypothetical protein
MIAVAVRVGAEEAAAVGVVAEAVALAVCHQRCLF